jgi:hypothetical protein
MANKWNTTDIEKISTAFTHKNLEKCFQDYDQISGEEIVNATDYPQINYFILREIFQRWEEETQKFKSIYFDFESEEVKKSFQDFKNTLSRHIQVSKADFSPLLEQATRKTLELYMKPEAFFIADFRNLPDFKLTPDWLSRNTVFFKHYDGLLKELKEALTEDFMYANQALEIVKNKLQQHTEDYSEEIESIAQAAGLELRPAPEVKAPENDNLSFFERLVANPPKPSQSYSEPEVSPFERLVSKAKVQAPVQEEPEMEAPAVETPVLETQTMDVEKNSPSETKAPAVEIAFEPSTPAPKAIANAPQPDHRSVFDGLNIPTLNDKHSVQEGNSLADLQQRSRIDSLKGSLSLNQRFSFLNALFDGNLQNFEAALNMIEESSDYATAKAQLETKYGQNWKPDSEDLKDFLHLIKRRLS